MNFEAVMSKVKVKSGYLKKKESQEQERKQSKGKQLASSVGLLINEAALASV